MPRPTPTRILNLWSLAFTAALTLTVGAGFATAQTVVVTHAPPGGAVELVFDSDRVQTATADADGTATLKFGLPAAAAEADVRVSTERCGDTRRVLLVERGLQAPPVAGACDRRDIADVFAVRRTTTFVVDMQELVPSVHLRQGPAPPSWLGAEGPGGEGRQLPPPPAGLILFAGGGFAASSDATTVACGTVTDCTSADLKGSLTAGAGYWITKNIGVQASYLRPADFTDSGSGDGFRFKSTRKTEVMMLSGTVGGPVGGTRIYGRGGAAYHRATLTTTETIDASGTQTLELKTAGWGWVAAGGVEVWLKPFVGVYVDGGMAKLQGNAVGGGEGSLDDRLIFATVGVRVHVGR